MSIAVQYNDPDPILWMVIYFLPILLGSTHLLGHNIRLYAIGLAILYTIYAVWIYPGPVPAPFNNEEFRETGGLLICVFYMVGLAVNARSNRS